MTAPPAPPDPRLTEQRNPDTADIDLADPARIVFLMNREDRRVAEAVWGVREAVARAIELVERAFRSGGRLIYVGAGTSGRLGVLDAAECPPTFGSPPAMVQGVIAGGGAALVRSAEGAEDDFDAGAAAVDGKDAGASDVVFGIAASGTTPYVRGALSRAATRGARTILLSCTDPPRDLLLDVDLAILPKVGPEALTGSTRLKAGTATKLVLNTVTTGAMIRMGRAYGNLMVDLVALSDKLRDRGERIVMEVCGVAREAARAAIEAAGGHVKTAVVMLKRGVDRVTAERLLEKAGGYARRAAGEPPAVRGEGEAEVEGERA
jgi:N-acetylmuramic acid 6-phosphate etherase